MFGKKRKIVESEIVKINLRGYNPHTLDKVGREIKDIAVKSGIDVKGPQPNPTKTVVSGGEEKELHSRTIKLRPFGLKGEQAVKRLLRLSIPEDVKIAMSVEKERHEIPRP